MTVQAMIIFAAGDIHGAMDRLYKGNPALEAALGVHHTRVDGEVAGVPCIGLAKVCRPGNLVVIDVESRGRDGSILGEWPASRQPATRSP